MSKPLRASGKPQMERVLIPYLSIIYPPYSENISKRSFSVLFTLSLIWIKEKTVAALSDRTFANKKSKTSI